MSERTPLLSSHPRDAPGFLSILDAVLIFPALLLNMFLAAFESTIAASTQSSVGDTFRASDNIAWVATSYLIVSTAVQPLYGRASDHFGRTTVYIFALTFFAAGCLGCGLSKSLGQMIAARALCGIGGGGLITISQVCAWDLLAVRRRPLYQALNNVVYGLGAAVGASLGGFLSDSIGWRWGYLAPVPLSIFSILVFMLRAKPKLASISIASTPKLADIDINGSILLMFSITILMLIISLGGNQIPWSSPLIPVLLVTCALATTLFLRHERRFPFPVLPTSLVRTRRMVSQVGLNLFGPMTVFATLYSIPVYFQSVHLVSASIASRRLLYPTLTAPLGSILTGTFLHRYPTKAALCQRVGSLVMLGGAAAMLLLSFETTRKRSEWFYLAHLIWVHAGMGILFISSLLDVLSQSGDDHAAATSLIFLLRSIGTVLGIAGSQAVLQNVLLHQLKSRLAGPDNEKIIIGIRESLAFISQLDWPTQQIAVRCYTVAFRATFGALVAAAGCTLLSAALGIGAKSKGEKTQEEASGNHD
ncbi:major facilitator superfamily domain-containing protein [Naematelia encephala]|uniref:Major facilitator superfamily domain-containing protein n=1 Tax=Naematelia encephala TaxID=71784 RepID=A0A1Y2AZ25_9TREE|nr:major facilitator superfamily domain-containing protein [Naematelia encephala]